MCWKCVEVSQEHHWLPYVIPTARGPNHLPIVPLHKYVYVYIYIHMGSMVDQTSGNLASALHVLEEGVVL